MRIHRYAPVVVAGLTLAVAAPALAAVNAVFTDGGYQVYGDAADDSIIVSCDGGNIEPAPVPDAACTDVETVFIDPGAGPDDVTLSAMTAADFPALTSTQISADDTPLAADSITGSPVGDFIEADYLDTVEALAGDDVITGGADVDGGNGNDVLIEVTGGGGASGGAGDDRFVQTVAQGGLDGGPGHDTVEMDFDRVSGLPGVSIVLTSAQLLVSAPGAGAAAIFMANFEEGYFVLPRGGGTQSFNAAQFPGAVHVRGSFGSDVVTGSKLGDVLKGRAGNDTLNARDGRPDLVDCGAGTDTATVDPQDVVTGCETVRYPTPATKTIKGPKKIKQGASASFTFGSSIAGSVFECKVDKGKWKTCGSPYRVATKKLKPGQHKLFVRAGYPRGNWDPTPAKKTFTVTK